MTTTDYTSSFNRTVVPPEISKIVGDERTEFCVKAAKAYSRSSTSGGLIFGLIWTAFSSIFVVIFFGPLFFGKEVNFESNGTPVTASLDNLTPLIIPGLIIGFFLVIGITILTFSIISLFKEGSWFIGTPSRLIVFSKNETRSIDWEQFNGITNIKGDSQNAEINLQLRTGRYQSRKNAPDRYVPDSINIISIKDGFNIEQICRKRIKENDPTPTAGNEKSENPGII